MKHRFILSFIFAATCSMAWSAGQPLKFAPQSRLDTGKWVKIGVDRNGVYEISYETLRSMGFSNPERVGVYGRGGAQLNSNFVSAGGTVLYKDDIDPVSVLHYDGKLYFYGKGPENFNIKVNNSVKYPSGGYFSRDSKNIYCETGYYFLSDSQEPRLMPVQSVTNESSLIDHSSGIGIFYHEEDLYHNNSGTGQLYYGEHLTKDAPEVSFPVTLPGALPGEKGAIECYFYTDRGIKNSTFSLGMRGASDITPNPIGDSASTNFFPQTPTISPATFTGDSGEVFLRMDLAEDVDTDVSNLDFMVLSYQRSIPDLTAVDGSHMNQDMIAFPKMATNKAAKVRIPGGASYLALDIADTSNPIFLQPKTDGADAIVKMVKTSAPPCLVVFDPLVPQYQIKGYENDFKEITNQNLHGQAVQGADLIIICIPQLRESAERLAQLHRDKEGLRVIVATTEECYNEFSSGVPDPMAYRALVKMAYDSDYSCRNLLLLGPLYADFRGIINEKQPEEGIIGYQATPMNQIRGAHNCNFFYGMMDEYVNQDNLEKANVQVGVGILPVRYPAEAETAIDKIEKHLEFPDYAYFLNQCINIGGVGDNHKHDRQALNLATEINKLEHQSTIFTPIVVDAYGYVDAKAKLFSSLDNGSMLVYYFGHGAPHMLNHNGAFFRSADVYRLRNTIHPFMGFAGCKLTIPDLGTRGIGESVVTSTPYGMLGTLVSTRETWSDQNLDFFKRFFESLYDTPYISEPVTIGEVFAKTLTSSIYNNEMAYQLICDPSIVIPTVSRPIVLDNAEYDGFAGEYVDIEGFVSDADGNCDTSFDGTAVIKLMEPYQYLRSADLCTTGDSSESSTVHDLDILYADTQLATVSAEVTSGRFSARLFIPQKAETFNGSLGRLYVAAYSDRRRLGAGCRYPLTYKVVESGESSAQRDNVPPVVDIFEYSPDSNAITLRASDNLAMAFDTDPLRPSTRLYIDGKEYAAGARTRALPESDSKAFRKDIPLADISEGTHAARVVVCDAAGNTSESHLSFDYLPYATAYAIRMEESAVDSVCHIIPDGVVPAAADIMILNDAGRLICRAPFSAEGFEWDACDLDGNRVAPGVYKAYIIEKGDAPRKGHSPAIDIPVI